MRVLLSYISPYKGYFLFAYLVIIISSAAILAFGRSLSTLVDAGLLGGSDASPAPFVGLMFLVFAIAIGSFLRIWLCGKGAAHVVKDIRRQLYDKILSLSASVLENTSISLLMTRLITDTAALQTVLSGSVLVILRNITVLLSSVGMLVHTSLDLTVRVALVLPVLILIIAFVGKRVKGAAHVLRDKTDELVHFGEETCSGIAAVQMLVAEDIVRLKFSQLLDKVSTATYRHVLLRALLVTLVIAAVTGAIGLVLWIGLGAVGEKSMSVGTLLSFIFYSTLAAGSINGLGDNVHDLQKAADICEDIAALLSLDPGIKDSPDCVDIDSVKESVDINSVAFNYNSSDRDALTLRKISVSMRVGEKIAFVGYSGSGKSTIVNLLLRMYDIGQGNITIDGVDIKNISLKSLRSLFCVVPQCPVIFSGTILDNVTYGIKEYTEEQLRAAIEGASIADFVESLPEGLSTFVGERGMCLSEGQKQRIAIARVILRRPKVLILDEATSALDTDNEHKILEVLDRLMRGKLTIMVAHRLTTVVNADKIVVLSDGVVREVGTHAELMKDKSSTYARLFELQYHKSTAGSEEA